jgi:hypothetical protein
MKIASQLFLFSKVPSKSDSHAYASKLDLIKVVGFLQILNRLKFHCQLTPKQIREILEKNIWSRNFL